MTKFLKLGFLSTVLSNVIIQPRVITDVCKMDAEATDTENFPTEGWSFTVNGENFDGTQPIELNQALEVAYSGDEIQSFSMQVRPIQSNTGVGEWTSDLSSNECSGIGSLDPVTEVSATWVQTVEATIGITHRLMVSAEKDGQTWQRFLLFSFDVAPAAENDETTIVPDDGGDDETTTAPNDEGDDEITTAPNDDGNDETTANPSDDEVTSTTEPNEDEDGTTPSDSNDETTEKPGDDEGSTTTPSSSINLKVKSTFILLALAKIF